MGGSLSKPLTCGDESNIITYFSEKLIPAKDLNDLHFVEIISNELQSATEYARIRFFTHGDDLDKIKDIIDLEDNLAH